MDDNTAHVLITLIIFGFLFGGLWMAFGRRR